MADKKISELVNLTSLATDDEFVVVDADANATKRITATNLSKFPSGVTVPDAGTIGSASDPDAMAISSGGVVTFSQGLRVASGAGIAFDPYGTGDPANTLDDYEEGTFTPTISYGGWPSGTVVLSGEYRKIGQVVFFTITVDATSTSGTSGGQLGFTLPFANQGQAVRANVFINVAISANDKVIGEINAPGGTNDDVRLRELTGTGNSAYASAEAGSNVIHINGVYRTS